MSATSSVPAWKRKSTLVMLAILAALAVFGTTTQTWLHVSIAQGAVQQSDLNIPGSKAAVAVSALALVALAGALAATIAGRVARIITGVIVLLAAAGIIVVVLGVLADPSAAAMAEVGKATGVVGVASNAATTWFPVAAVIAAAVLALAAVLILWAGRGWTVRSRYDAAAAPGAQPAPGAPIDEVDSWDRLSRGDDPTA
ncbi:Trp biosynthesis-associated membrane protein [Arthrobacter sp. STN4]|uniref:Trp biosynthesis-associated membrane protein n=1 Tax=Arthrobacter sp. STN4 TaxID=2923276 RepID=UPI00211A6093|nr:Trp biosynthesis-associated membrane protein [Arthrobacter sp. STN4]MCQ9164028.1 Trp biosynthesis-associated membrane protein [Arthrobacter sp. STN4]